MDRSELINELATALSKAQVGFGAIKRSGSNPMFHSKYSTFDDVLAVVRQPLADNGLSFTQMLDVLGDAPALTTYLMHTSGQWMSATVPVIAMAGNKGTNEVQVFGSALTYMKRYALTAMLGVAGDEDDDGNGATHKPAVKRTPRPTDNISVNNAPDYDDPFGDESPPNSGLPFLVVDRVGATTTKSGKKCVGLWEPEKQYPTFYWWGGRDALLEKCPWLVDSVTKDELGEVGKTYPFSAKVFYVLNDKDYKDIDGFERIA